MLPGCDHDPKVSSLAALLGLDQHAGRVGTQERRRHRVGPHRIDQGMYQRGQLIVPAADRRASQVHALPRVDLLQPIGWQGVVPASDDGVREQAWSGHAALDREVDRGRRQHLCLGVSLTIHEDKLRTTDPQDHHRGLPALEHLGDLFANTLKCIEAHTLDVLGQDLDLHPRKMLGQHLSAGPLATLGLLLRRVGLRRRRRLRLRLGGLGMWSISRAILSLHLRRQ